MLLHKMNSFNYYFYEDVGRGDACMECLNVLKKLQVYNLYLLKLNFFIFIFTKKLVWKKSKDFILNI